MDYGRFRVVDLEQARHILRTETGDGDRPVLVEASTNYPGELSFAGLLDQRQFLADHTDYLSKLGVLNDLFMLGTLVDKLEAEGRTVLFLASAAPSVRRYLTWSTPLTIEDLRVPNGGQLFPFQQFALQRILAMTKTSPLWNGFFVSFDTGTGKSLMQAALVQELVCNHEDFDLVLTFAPAKLKLNLARSLNQQTDANFLVIEGTKAKRFAAYAEEPRSLVLNYERCHFDEEALLRLVKGKRVLFLCDEVQKCLMREGKQTLARKALTQLIRASARAFVVPLSATVVKRDPLRYHDVFSLLNPTNPLGTRSEFKRHYLKGYLQHQWNNREVYATHEWDLQRLEEVRHRVAIQTQAVRKTDPGVRELFKDMSTIVERIELSESDQELYDHIINAAIDSRTEENPGIEAIYYLLLKGVCNTAESLAHVNSEVARDIVALYPDLITSATSNKFDAVAEKAEEIAGQGDKMVIFTSLTNMTLHLFEEVLKKRHIPFISHHGGMSHKAAQKAVDDFKASPAVPVLLSSDAGAYGLNLQECKYVLHLDVPTMYDVYKQRTDRIDRADSYLDGLTSYVFLTTGTIEDASWAKVNAARILAAATMGTAEVIDRPSAQELNRLQRLSSRSLESLVFGTLPALRTQNASQSEV